MTIDRAELMEEGYRADLATVAPIADLDDHEVVVDFPHEVLDNYRTDWGRGCWDDSFARRLPVMVWNHNADMLIGGGKRAENLGDRSRVVQRFADFDAVPQAKAAHSMIADGIVPGFSFHFRNGRTVAHPSERAARRFVKADMLEVSPVTFPSIPGAVAVGIRSAAAVLDVPSVDEILRLLDRDLLDVAGVRALIAEHHPSYREHITVQADMLEKPAGEDEGDVGERADDDTATLAAAADAALDEACNLFDGADTASLPEPVQQGIALAHAASVAVDELLEVLGVDDPDEDGVDGGRSGGDEEPGEDPACPDEGDRSGGDEPASSVDEAELAAVLAKLGRY